MAWSVREIPRRTKEKEKSHERVFQSTQGLGAGNDVAKCIISCALRHHVAVVHPGRQKNKRGKVEAATFTEGAMKLGLSADEASLLFAAVDTDGDGAATLGDLNDASKSHARAEAGLPELGPGPRQPQSRDTTPRKRRRFAFTTALTVCSCVGSVLYPSSPCPPLTIAPLSPRTPPRSLDNVIAAGAAAAAGAAGGAGAAPKAPPLRAAAQGGSPQGGSPQGGSPQGRHSPHLETSGGSGGFLNDSLATVLAEGGGGGGREVGHGEGRGLSPGRRGGSPGRPVLSRLDLAGLPDAAAADAVWERLRLFSDVHGHLRPIELFRGIDKVDHACALRWADMSRAPYA